MEHYICEQLNEIANDVGAVYVEDKETQTLRFERVGNAQLTSFVPLIKQYAYKKGIKKLSVKVSDAQAIYFFQHGFKVEACILAYFGLQDAIFLVYFFDDEPSQLNTRQHDILDKALASQEQAPSFSSHSSIIITTENSRNQAPKTNGLSQETTTVYSGRTEAIVDDECVIFNASIHDDVIASAKAQFNQKDKAVEFSNFKVCLNADVQNAIGALLDYMTIYYRDKGAETAFTIVSANSLSINTICADNQFEFGGTLKNESIIDGRLSHLNTWFKRL